MKLCVEINFVSGRIEKQTRLNLYPKKVTINNLFQIGSITKSFTAAIILQLEAEGKLSINDTIADTVKQYGKWLPEKGYSAWKDITIKQLLNMTSGIFDVTEDPGFFKTMAEYPEKNWTSEEILKFAYKHDPYFPPGKGWHYSNTNYNLLGMLIEAVTKHSVETEMKQRLLGQNALNLTHTYYLPSRYSREITNQMAHGYAYPNGDFSPPIKSGSDTTRFNMSIAGPSGAMISNSADITYWIRSLFTGKVLHPTQLQEMMSAVCMVTDGTCNPGEPIQPNSRLQGFSLGLVHMYDPQLGQAWVYVGSTAGYYSAFAWLPEKKIALAMTISATSSKSKKILKTLMNAAKLLPPKADQ